VLLASWREQLAALDGPWRGVVADDPLDLPPPLPPALVASRLGGVRDDDTMPLALVPLPRGEEAVVQPLETPPRGLRTFDLGSVPASVTPPRTWRKAAWFAIGTSAAVVCGLAVAAVRLVGAPSASDTIDALPAFPTEPLDLEELPAQHTSEAATDSAQPSSSASASPTSDSTTSSARDDRAAPDPSSGVVTTTGAGEPLGTATTTDTEPSESSTEPPAPTRTTVGAAMIMAAADTDAMGDRTEQYFALVTEDAEAAHDLCAGAMAREGPEAIEARYAGVERVEVQRITIDRAQAITTSRVKVVREDGSSTIEERRLTFTWGGDPRISDEVTTA